MSTKQVNDMYLEVCFLGPLAAMFGREVQQTLMSPDAPDKIPVEDFQYSVGMGRTALRQDTLKSSWQRDDPTDYSREEDQVSQTSRRTRSPRKALYYGNLREQPDYRQSTDVRERPDYRQSTDVRERPEHRRSTDVRDRPDHRQSGDIRERRPHTQSETRYDRNTQERSRRR